MQYAFLPIFLFVACVIALGVGLLLMAGLFNPGRSGCVTRMPYESGMDPVHDTRRRFDVRFHLLAITFLVFDVELLFLFPWAVASQTATGNGGMAVASTASAAPQSPLSGPESRDSAPPSAVASAGIDAAVAQGAVESRHLVFGGAMMFLALLVLGFVYDWRKGVFQWR